MANINVSYAELTQTAKELGAGREEITQQFTALQNKISALVSSGFVTDKASAKFETAYTGYTKSAKEVTEKLSEIENFLTQTAKAMAELDAQIAAKIAA